MTTPLNIVHLLDCGWRIALAHVAAVNCFGRDADGTTELHIYTVGRPDPIRVRTIEDRDRFFTAWERWEEAQ